MAQSDESSGMVLLTGNSHPQLAALIAEHLQTRLGDAVVYNKPNRYGIAKVVGKKNCNYG